MLESKFKDEKGNSFHVNSYHRLLSPSNRSDRDNRMKVGMNGKISNFASP